MYTFSPLRNISALLKKGYFKPCFTVRNQHKGESTQEICQSSEKQPITMKIESPAFKSIITDDVKYLFQLYNNGGFEIKIAGGAVRDLLLDIIPEDIDFATTATPQESKLILQNNKIKTINKKGEYHGTVTARYNDRNYEITTLRADVITDGRHAQVSYTTDWYTDANRRDLTMNSMFLDIDGNVYDYFKGIRDVQKRRVAFVGDASTRIKEDYLRILRYFRFFGKINSPLNEFDDTVIEAIKSNADGLVIISGERIKSEIFKIIGGNNGIELLKKIISLGIGRYMGFPEGISFDELDRISELIKKHNFDMNPITILCAVLDNPEQATNLVHRFKTSAYERDLCLFIVNEREKNKKMEQPLSYFQSMTLLSRNKKLMRRAIIEYLMYEGQTDLLKKYLDWKEIRFPLTGLDIIQREKKYLNLASKITKKLLILWIESNFTLLKDDLLKHIDAAVNEITREESQELRKKEKPVRSVF